MAWLFGILRNVILESNRSVGRAKRLAQRNIADATTYPSVLDFVETAAEANDERRTLWAAFALLHIDDRELLGLRVIGELTRNRARAAISSV